MGRVSIMSDNYESKDKNGEIVVETAYEPAYGIEGSPRLHARHERNDNDDDDVVEAMRTCSGTFTQSDEQNEPVEISEKPRLFQFMRTKWFWIIFLHGQVLSLCIVATNTFTTFLADGGNSIPAFQTLFNYAILALVFTPYTIYKYGFKKWAKLLYKDGWKFFLFAFADVQGNYFVVKAYAYTNLLSAELLDMFSIVVVMVLSFLFLKVRYTWNQYLGAFICIVGMVLVVVSDKITGKNYAGSDVVKGDLFVLLGAACYGVSNVLEEFFVSKRPLYEVVGQLGFWAVLINGVQCAIFERESLRDAQWSGEVGGYFAGYTLSMLLLYCTAPILFRMSSSAFYNLSLLTSDFWGLIVGIHVFHLYVYWLYPIGFVCTIVGLVVYYAISKTILGEADKPWLKENEGIKGVGTIKAKDQSIATLDDDLEYQTSITEQR